MTEETNDEFINRYLAAIKQKITQAKESYDHDQLKQAPAEEEDIYDAVLMYRKEHLEKEKLPRKQRLADVQKEYIQLLIDELSDLASVAYVHGWKSNRVDAGIKLREKMAEIEQHKATEIQPTKIAEYFNEKGKRLMDEYGWTGEYRLTPKDIIDFIIDRNS